MLNISYKLLVSTSLFVDLDLWQPLNEGGGLKSLCLGKAGLYCITIHQDHYGLTTKWNLLARSATSCTVNDNNDFWVSRWGYTPVFRTGISVSSPLGSNWIFLNGETLEMSSGRRGMLFIATRVQTLFIRTGITDSSPQGSSWSLVRSYIT